MAFIAPDETLVAFHNYCYVFRKRIAVFLLYMIMLRGGHRGVVSLVQSSPFSPIRSSGRHLRPNDRIGFSPENKKKTFMRRFFLYCLTVNEE